MNKPNRTGLGRIIAAGGYSLRGLKAAFQSEAAIRQELFAAIFLVPLAFYLADNGIELALLLGSLILVFLMELINSAIEAIVDRISFEHHPLSGQAKDIGSALVMIAIVLVVIVWGAIIFYP
ncbi:diacylglycerol kinase [Ignatzschineria larvae DSM 13226]|uniref:Diacylglycerol kinase n=1 Tax=Ignatzschineria larvae DSM 13226 TaxID=1111732 RepID=A0ABZ3C1Z8_9GAMM|nr:diacylglycerol kinase [Ignatzschineria larvae]